MLFAVSSVLVGALSANFFIAPIIGKIAPPIAPKLLNEALPNPPLNIPSIIKEFKTEISSLDDINREILEPIVNNLIKKHETNFKGVGQPLRVILTGSKFGPGLYDILISLGKKEVEKRLGQEISR